MIVGFSRRSRPPKRPGRIAAMPNHSLVNAASAGNKKAEKELQKRIRHGARIVLPGRPMPQIAEHRTIR